MNREPLYHRMYGVDFLRCGAGPVACSKLSGCPDVRDKKYAGTLGARWMILCDLQYESEKIYRFFKKPLDVIRQYVDRIFLLRPPRRFCSLDDRVRVRSRKE